MPANKENETIYQAAKMKAAELKIPISSCDPKVTHMEVSVQYNELSEFIFTQNLLIPDLQYRY